MSAAGHRVRWIRACVAFICGAALLGGGLPAAAQPQVEAEPETAVSGDSGMSIEEILGQEPDDDQVDPRRRAEEDGAWDAERPRPESEEPVRVTEIRPNSSGDRERRKPTRSPRWGVDVVWPKPGKALVPLSEHIRDSGDRGARANGLPVWVAPANGSAAPAADSAVAVEVLNRGVARAQGAALAITLNAASSGVDAAGSVDMTVDYSGFEHAYGGDFGSRLVAKVFDADCVASGETCVGTEVESLNDPVQGTVTATVALEAGSDSVVMLTTEEDGPAGDWAATSLAPSAEWSHGGSSGGFSWSYPLRTPDMPGGLGPDLSVSYSSQSVDGRTLSTNNQTSSLGEGFAMDPGFIERRYVSCADDMGDGANNAVKKGDLCWKTDNAVLNLGGMSTPLVKDTSTGRWRLEKDDGSRIEHLTGGYSPDDNGEYWRLTTKDGVQYYFGKTQRNDADPARTGSVLTVPVFGNHAGEPCHASSFGSSWCQQGWRWNLDYVVDPNNNTMTYFYTQESNRYGLNLNAQSVSYKRGSYLKRIEYGTRKGSEGSAAAPARVVFTNGERCLSDCGSLTESTADNWPDVPFDQICSSSTSCPDRFSPTFFTRKRWTKIETHVRTGGVYEATDQWTLTHSFPDPGDGNSAALWLKSIQHTGLAGSSSIDLPSVTFAGEQLPNRVREVDTAPWINRWRVRAITSETGAVTSVNYSEPDCAPGQTMPSPQSNTTRCYPVFWAPEGVEHDDPEIYWFHKYVVDSVIEGDSTGGGVATETHYTYHGNPAWAYNDDKFVKAQYRTWGEWRGYGKVTTTVGNANSEQTRLRTERTYMRGLHGDRAAPDGSTRTVSVTDSWGDSVTDHKEWAGFLREEIVFNGSTKVTSTVHDPWRSAVTADDGDSTARMTDVDTTKVHTKLESGSWRTTATSFTYDSDGLITETDDKGDTSKSGDNRCTRTWYAKNTTKHIVETVKRTETVAVGCSATPSRPGDVVSDERYAYDGGGYGDAPVRGNLTTTEVLDDWNGGPVYVATDRSTYDAHGRVTSSKDALDRVTTTGYTPSTGGPVTKTVVTNPAGHATTTVLNPVIGQPTKVTDANGKVTEASYDSLGRLRKVWQTDRDKATQTPSVEYTYQVSKTQPVAVTTKKLIAKTTDGHKDEAYATSVVLYDSLLRERQIQTPAAGDGGGRVVSLTEYDSRGLAVMVKGPFHTTGSPSTTLVGPVTGTETVKTETSFDGAGRETMKRLLVANVEHSRTTTVYGGDRVHVTPPGGGTASTEITDVRGNVIEKREYRGGTPSGSFDATTYTFTARDDVKSMTDAAGNTWTYSYDLRGQRTEVDDPDAGVSTTVYDDAGQVLEATDGRGVVVKYSYDALGRKNATTNADGTVLAEWTYDTLAKGQLTASASYTDGEPWTHQIVEYDDAYRVLEEKIVVPSSQGALAGEFRRQLRYYTDGSLYLELAPGWAGLPEEILRTDADDVGLPSRYSSPVDTYVAGTTYTPYGEVNQLSLGADVGREVWQTFEYEEGTRRLSRVRTDRATTGPADSDVRYSYDEAGNPVRIADTGEQAGTTPDVQCFTFDHVRRMTGAWSQTTQECAADPESAVLGGPNPYGQSYTYNTAGNRTTLVEHGVGGAADTTTTYTYPSAGFDRPHAATGSDTSGGETGSSSWNYDGAGNTTAQTDADGTTTYGWDAQGRMTSVTGPDGTSENVYGADGDRLLRITPDRTTLYIFGSEITLDHATGAVSGKRYYSFAGHTIAHRDTTTGSLVTLGADRWGTPKIAVDNATTDVTVRRQDPFGNPRNDSGDGGVGFPS